MAGSNSKALQNRWNRSSQLQNIAMCKKNWQNSGLKKKRIRQVPKQVRTRWSSHESCKRNLAFVLDCRRKRTPFSLSSVPWLTDTESAWNCDGLCKPGVCVRESVCVCDTDMYDATTGAAAQCFSAWTGRPATHCECTDEDHCIPAGSKVLIPMPFRDSSFKTLRRQCK